MFVKWQEVNVDQTFGQTDLLLCLSLGCSHYCCSQRGEPRWKLCEQCGMPTCDDGSMGTSRTWMRLFHRCATVRLSTEKNNFKDNKSDLNRIRRTRRGLRFKKRRWERFADLCKALLWTWPPSRQSFLFSKRMLLQFSTKSSSSVWFHTKKPSLTA